MKKLLYCIWALTSGLSGFAQSEIKHNTFRLLCLDGFVTDMAYDLAAKKIKVFASQSDFSPNYIQPKNGRDLVFYKEIPNPDLTSPFKTIKQTLAIAKPTTPSERMIILLFPAPEGSAVPYESICIPDSYEKHKLETIALYNLSTKLIAVKIEDYLTSIAPEQTTVAPYSSKNAGLAFSLAVNKPSGWESVMSTLTVAAPHARVFAFIKDLSNASTAEGANPVIFRLVYDTQPPPEAKSKAPGL